MARSVEPTTNGSFEATRISHSCAHHRYMWIYILVHTIQRAAQPLGLFSFWYKRDRCYHTNIGQKLTLRHNNFAFSRCIEAFDNMHLSRFICLDMSSIILMPLIYWSFLFVIFVKKVDLITDLVGSLSLKNPTYPPRIIRRWSSP